MRIITLQGMPSTGKTSTLSLVYNFLLQNGGSSTNRQLLGGDPNDFSDVMEIRNQRIAFYTMGDYSNYLANAIYNYDSQACDLLICALSTNSPKVRANKALNQFNAFRLNKTIAINSNVELSTNTIDAQTIFHLI